MTKQHSNDKILLHRCTTGSISDWNDDEMSSLVSLEATEHNLGQLPTSVTPLQSFDAYPGIDLEPTRNDLPGPARLTKKTLLAAPLCCACTLKPIPPRSGN